jgi:peptide deformylase
VAIKPILKYNAPELRQVCPPFDWNNPEHVAGLQDLHDTLADAQGGRALGLAANQIGLMARAFAFRMGGQIEIAVNPKVYGTDPTMVTEEESCLSFPNLKAKVQRPASGRVIYETGPIEDRFVSKASPSTSSEGRANDRRTPPGREDQPARPPRPGHGA